MDFLMDGSMISGITSPCEAGKWSGTVVDDPAFCICCGADVPGVEADARPYECEPCGEPGVYGADEFCRPSGDPNSTLKTNATRSGSDRSSR
jgi:hypothetical protein